jgi:hypothetical protein
MSQSHISIQQLNSRGKNIAVSASNETIGVPYAAKDFFLSHNSDENRKVC